MCSAHKITTPTGGSTPHPLLLKLLHLVHKAHPFLPNNVGARHDNILKKHLSSIRRMVPHFIYFVCSDSTGFHWDTYERFVLVRVTLSCVGKETNPVSLDAIGDPHLAAIDDQVI